MHVCICTRTHVYMWATIMALIARHNAANLYSSLSTTHIVCGMYRSCGCTLSSSYVKRHLHWGLLGPDPCLALKACACHLQPIHLTTPPLWMPCPRQTPQPCLVCLLTSTGQLAGPPALQSSHSSSRSQRSRRGHGLPTMPVCFCSMIAVAGLLYMPVLCTCAP